MCLAIPGRITEIKEGKAVVDYGDCCKEKREAIIAEEGLKIGDYVLVQAGFAVKKVPEKEALESLKAWQKPNK